MAGKARRDIEPRNLRDLADHRHRIRRHIDESAPATLDPGIGKERIGLCSYCVWLRRAPSRQARDRRYDSPRRASPRRGAIAASCAPPQGSSSPDAGASSAIPSSSPDENRRTGETSPARYRRSSHRPARRCSRHRRACAIRSGRPATEISGPPGIGSVTLTDPMTETIGMSTPRLPRNSRDHTPPASNTAWHLIDARFGDDARDTARFAFDGAHGASLMKACAQFPRGSSQSPPSPARARRIHPTAYRSRRLTGSRRLAPSDRLRFPKSCGCRVGRRAPMRARLRNPPRHRDCARRDT